MPIALQPAFVLHRRSYRETSLIIELFTLDQGRIAAVARGIRKAKSRTASLLQPFVPIFVSWYGKGELVTLTQVESNGYCGALVGRNLRCGFYLNELLMRLLPKQDPHASLFAIYQQTLTELRQGESEQALRLFEKNLLIEIGYGLPLKNEISFSDEGVYHFDHERGFLPHVPGQGLALEVFSGKTLNALLNENFENSQILQDIKRLMRFVFATLLGDKPLQSRKLFEY